ncbi:hypothetical protein HYX16_02010 [Candidatus Woesearchaeota archaeon]|nr:hypothetical protein [Candidatus Woesearchaeota archaeon]
MVLIDEVNKELKELQNEINNLLVFYSKLDASGKKIQSKEKAREDTSKLISQLKLIKSRISRLGERGIFSKSLIQRAIEEQETGLTKI